MASNNPLFDKPVKKDEKPSGYVLPSNKKQIKPKKDHHNRNAAANVIRKKLDKLYAEEPAAKQELSSLTNAEKPFSKHQKFLQELQSHTTSIAEIQTKWHQYYVGLPADEKHEVWQEFYTEQANQSRYVQFKSQQQEAPSRVVVSKHEPATLNASHKRLRDSRSTREVKEGVRRKVSASRQREQKGPMSSIIFGIATGGAVLIVMLFGLFNERVIAPFIQPSRNVSATPIILNDASIAADGTTKVIIPKINVEIPVDYDVPSMQEDDIQKGLENGVVHYPSTVRPGEQGNSAIFGHSSNNIFNPGKFKFAFVLLNKLENGDMFYLTYNKQVYAYKVYEKRVVSPDQVSILNAVEGKAATAALITCDPPGTTINRLVVWGEQVSPSPANNVAAGQGTVASNTEMELAGNAPSLWHRMTSWLF